MGVNSGKNNGIGSGFKYTSATALSKSLKKMENGELPDMSMIADSVDESEYIVDSRGNYFVRNGKKGRPKRVLTNEQWKIFEECAEAAIPKAKMAQLFMMTPETLDSLVRERYSANGKSMGIADVYAHFSARGEIDYMRHMKNLAFGRFGTCDKPATMFASAKWYGSVVYGRNEKQEVVAEDLAETIRKSLNYCNVIQGGIKKTPNPQTDNQLDEDEDEDLEEGQPDPNVGVLDNL